MTDISLMISELIEREGGFVNDPQDPGGATKFGITLETLSSARGKRCTISDVKALSKSEATKIYKDKYFYRPKIDQLPDALQNSVFDMYVNAGSRAIKILQETLNKFGTTLKVDGAIGPNTIMGARAVYQIADGYLVDAYGIERRDYYYRLADSKASSRKYARTRAGNKGGWIKRAEEFISPKYQLSDSQHRARTASWR